MIEQRMRLVVTFHTTADAMALEQLCKMKHIPGKLFSAPRALSFDCGIAWQSPPKARAALETAIEESGLDIHGLHEMAV